MRRFDDQGNPIKDNQFFNIREHDGNWYLNFENPTGLPVFDYESPKDANGDNVYELVLQLRDYGSGLNLEQQLS